MLPRMSSAFSSLALSPELLAVVAELGYEVMTPIQAQSIPVLLAGRDLVGQSKTGSGKTAAFGLPMLHNLDSAQRELQALVLCPTRELCAQVARELRKLGRRHAGLQVLTLSGGEPLRPQARALERGVQVAVGTPGRVLDHLRRGTLDLRGVTAVVLDEADRMLDMGFADDMDQILRALPSARQTAFFSATFPESIEAMSRAHQREALRITIDDHEEIAAEIRQLGVETEREGKRDALYEVLGRYTYESALIFCNLKATVKELARILCISGASVECLHGDLEQSQRDRVMAMFRNRSVRILVATDVAARGIDVLDLDLVVNYDLPAQPEIYVHRIGRTGRAGNQGLSVSLLTPRDEARRLAIEQLTGVRLERADQDWDQERGAAGLDAALTRAAAMDTIAVFGGRKDKVRPGDILGALTGEAGGLSAAEVGKIEIHDHLAYVAVARRASAKALTSLANGRIKGRRFRVAPVPRFEV